MNNYHITVKQKLWNIIDEMDNNSWLFSTKPGIHFSRKRKLSFADTMKLIIAMEGGSINEEMMEFFNYNLNTTPSQPAFNQQRSHIKYEAFYHAFCEFVSAFPQKQSYDGYQVLAADGSHVVYHTNPENVEDYVKPDKEHYKGYNQLHLNALYDIINRIFIDAVIHPGVKYNEHLALHEMLDQYEPSDPSHVILTVDRGYESYNLIAQLREKGMKFVIRVRDIDSSHSILQYYSSEFPKSDEFDIHVKRFITRSRAKHILEQPLVYKYIHPSRPFDYLDNTSKPALYYMDFRIVRFKISDTGYESIITNLSPQEFPPDKIKEIYHMRWDIETAFRHLKYAVGMMNFHAKKVDYIKQEIFAKLIVHNFSEIIASQASVSENHKRKKKHDYKINYTMAAKICHKFLKMSADIKPPDVIGWIQRFLSVAKQENRSFPRCLRGIGSVSFMYRVA